MLIGALQIRCCAPFDRKKGSVTLALNSHKEVCAVHKLGGVALSPDQLLECMRVAHVKAIELAAVLNTALKADEAAREGTDNRRGPSLREIKKKRSKITHSTEGVTDATVAELGDDADEDGEGAPAKLHRPGPKTAELFSGSASKWDGGEDKA